MPKGYRKDGSHLGFQKGHIAWNKNGSSWNKGKKFSEETCRRMSLAHLGQVSPRLGKKLSEETRKKLSLSHVGKCKGEKHPLWKGGVTKNRNYKRDCNRLYRYKRGKHYAQLCYHKRKSLTLDLTFKVIQLVYEDNIKQFGTLTCYLCLKPIPFGKDSLEHKIPLSRSGTNQYNNLGIACRSCNCKKHTKTEIEYIETLKNLAREGE